MARRRFHGLRKVKFRASWNKYNLYNLTRLRIPNVLPRTAYQQRWTGKSVTRNYHGEHVREKQWERMFRPRMNAVVPMDHKYLAENDGSELASGRGSGKDVRPSKDDSRKRIGKIPYMSMVYAPMERRLDMAVWRSLFASSARQARQFVIHGNVRVNGQKMPYPGYLLNPGDMFQVEPDRVLFATGAKKGSSEAKKGREEVRIARHLTSITRPDKLRKRGPAQVKAVTAAPIPASGINIEDVRKQRRADFEILLARLDKLLINKQNDLSAKRKQELRALRKEMLQVTRSVNRKNFKALEDDFNTMLARMTITAPSPEELAEARAEEDAAEEEAKAKEPTPEYVQALREAMVKARENPVDNTKPYATPWSPRPYMSPFAFIPRYLEVNHNICSAVYLRHPVARPGLTEVPSPFPQDIHQLAFNWYLRRR